MESLIFEEKIIESTTKKGKKKNQSKKIHILFLFPIFF